MNSTSKAVAKNDTAKWLLGIIGLLFIPGALWLASFLISYPQESLVLARKYGAFIWIALALAWSIQCLIRRKTEPNQAPEPTSTAVTPPAVAGDRASGTRGSS